jgi:hypothetical protein
MTKLLFLAANPLDTDPLRLDEEMRAIDISLRQADFRDQFELRSHWAVRISDLQELLLRHQPDVVHFSGHGSHASEIVLQDTRGHGVVVPVDTLSDLFGLFQDDIRCVVLNACYSADQAEAIAQQIDCVVGMTDAITDTASIEFATAFYRALGYGRSVKSAFDLGCNQIDLASLDEAHKPLLLGAADPELVFLAGSNKTDHMEASMDTNAIPWWEQVSMKPGDTETRAGGDVIIATIGAGARNVAVGKNITQQITEVLGEPTPDDKKIITQQFDQLKQALATLQQLQAAQLQVQLLEGELTKTGEDETPSASTITMIGNWLLDNIPEVAEALAGLFATPAVGRVIGKAGESAMEWVKARFGSV